MFQSFDLIELSLSGKYWVDDSTDSSLLSSSLYQYRIIQNIYKYTISFLSHYFLP